MTENLSYEEAIARVTAPGEQFEIADLDIAGKKIRGFTNAPRSLREIFAAQRVRGDAIFLVYENERWSFAETLARIDSMAAALVDDFSVKSGDRVAIAMRNYPEWVVAFAAITSVGGIAVCMNAWWTAQEMAYGLRDSGTSLLIADAERLERAEATLAALDIRAIVVRSEQALRAGAVHWSDALKAGTAMPDVDVAPDQDATILFTSGTTGHPKGAVSTHRAITNSLTAFAARATVGALLAPPAAPHPFPTSFILVVPLFHVTGLVPVMLSCFAGGFKLVVMYKWDPERALELIEREQITTFVGVPTMSFDLLESPDFASRDTQSLLSVGGGGAPAPPELVQRIEKGFSRGRPGIGYGMTETNAFGPGNSGDNYLRKPRSTGRVMPPMEIIIADENGEEVPCGEVGEIYFGGPTLIRGYWNNPEATGETIVNGWLKSGDIGRIDDEGFIYVEDRAKDMVLRAGENIYPAEVEAAIYEHPAVHEAAVFGMPHLRLGEEVASAIVTKRGAALTPAELQTHLKGLIASFKVPTIIQVGSEALPRNASGKILKRTIRDQWVAARES